MAILEAPSLPAAPTSPTIYLLLPLEADLILQLGRKLTQQKKNQNMTQRYCLFFFLLGYHVKLTPDNLAYQVGKTRDSK